MLCIDTLKTTDEAYAPKARVVFDQLRRAAVSVETNVVEGYALGTTPYFRQHLRIAYGSAAETECLIEVARERRYLAEALADPLRREAIDAQRVLFGLMRSRNLRAR